MSDDYDDLMETGYEPDSFDDETERVCSQCACYPGDTTCYCWHACSGCGGVVHNSEGDRCITCRTAGLRKALFPEPPTGEGR